MIRKIVRKESSHAKWSNYYFPAEDIDENNNVELQTTGYITRYNSKICDVCMDKREEDSAMIEIDDTYVSIIENLKKAGLLRKDYPLMCCRCFKEFKEYEKL